MALQLRRRNLRSNTVARRWVSALCKRVGLGLGQRRERTNSIGHLPPDSFSGLHHADDAEVIPTLAILRSDQPAVGGGKHDAVALNHRVIRDEGLELGQLAGENGDEQVLRH